MTKVCFEPKNVTLSDITTMFRFNRHLKASLVGEPHISPLYGARDIIAGLVIVVGNEFGGVTGIYFAMPSTYVGYSQVAYRRWKGKGFDEYI